MSVSRCEAGSRLGEWVLDELLGEGAFGQVWRAHAQADPGRRAALKVPREARGEALLRAEGAALRRVQGPHFPRLLGLSLDPPYAAFEYVAARSLREVLRERGRLAPAEAAPIARALAEALGEAHAVGVVHRDVKPENVLVADDGRVLLADLGLALPVELEHSLLAEEGSAEAALAGTIPYLAPEARAGRPVDARADLYAWGIVLYELLAGALPGAADLPSGACPGLPAAWDELYRRACAALERRFASAREALDALERAVRALPPSAAARPGPAEAARVDVRALLERCSREEAALREQDFMAYVTPAGKASARAGGKTYTFDVEGPPGLAVLRAVSPTRAVVVRRFPSA